MSEKRKNDARGGFQWWLLVIGVVLGVVLVIGVQTVAQGNNGLTNTAAQLPYTHAEIEMTATALMANAQTPAPTGMEALLGTATQMVREATGTAITTSLTDTP